MRTRATFKETSLPPTGQPRRPAAKCGEREGPTIRITQRALPFAHEVAARWNTRICDRSIDNPAGSDEERKTALLRMAQLRAVLRQYSVCL